MLARLSVFAVVATLCISSAPAVRADARASDAAAVLHVLNRLTYGPRPGDVERVKAIGIEKWIETQLNPSRIDDRTVAAKLARLETLNLDSQTIQRDYVMPAMQERRQKKAQDDSDQDDTRGNQQPPSEAIRKNRKVLTDLEEAKLLRAVYSERQLEEVLVDFWFNHFNVFAGKGVTRNYVGEYERDAIRPYVLGNFRDMLGATAKSPAMLFYLDNWLSGARGAQGARGARGAQGARGLNENYARELLELHTLGVDGGYTQQDIVNVAKAFTGWSMQPRQGTGFIFFVPRHDRSEKIVLGHTITAGGGIDDGERVLDIVASHPSTAKHIATKLAIRFVSDNPPPALVDRMTKTFLKTNGNLRDVMKTLLTSPEFLAPDVYRAKVKTPLEFVASALRATGADVRTALPLARTLKEMGMPLYFCQPPTGYDEVATTWVNAGALVARMNFAVDLSKNAIRGVRVPRQEAMAVNIGAPAFQRR